MLGGCGKGRVAMGSLLLGIDIGIAIGVTLGPIWRGARRKLDADEPDEDQKTTGFILPV